MLYQKESLTTRQCSHLKVQNGVGGPLNRTASWPKFDALQVQGAMAAQIHAAHAVPLKLLRQASCSEDVKYIPAIFSLKLDCTDCVSCKSST